MIQAVLGDKDQVISTIVSAFMNDPLHTYFAPNEKTRRRILTGMYHFLYSAYELTDDFYITSDQAEGVAMWDISNKSQDINIFAAGFDFILQGLFTIRIPALYRMLSYLVFSINLKKTYTKPYAYLFILTVHPEHQGKGVSRKLMDPMLAQFDRDKMPCYLETQNPVNIAIYQSYGFEVVKEYHIKGTQFTHYLMCRQPK